MKDDTIKTHESYAVAGFSRISRGGTTPLFGSSIGHNNTKDIKDTSSAMHWLEYYKTKDDGKKELQDYIKNNEIPLIKINEEFLNKPINN